MTGTPKTGPKSGSKIRCDRGLNMRHLNPRKDIQTCASQHTNGVVEIAYGRPMPMNTHKCRLVLTYADKCRLMPISAD